MSATAISAPLRLTRDTTALRAHAKSMRRHVLRMAEIVGQGYVGQGLGIADVLAAVYFSELHTRPAEPTWPGRDRFVLSIGHYAIGLYAALAEAGIIPVEELSTYGADGSRLEMSAPETTTGVEMTGGSLGHGLGVGLGMALASTVNKTPYSTYVMMSDGECQEGSVWEAAMLAPRLPIAPLTVLVDFNGWQATGRSREIMQMEPLHEKWASFGWDACEVDGHNIPKILDALNRPSDGKPKAIIARTTKGKGVSFIEDDNNWHYRSPSAEEVTRAAIELLGKMENGE